MARGPWTKLTKININNIGYIDYSGKCFDLLDAHFIDYTMHEHLKIQKFSWWLKFAKLTSDHWTSWQCRSGVGLGPPHETGGGAPSRRAPIYTLAQGPEQP